MMLLEKQKKSLVEREESKGGRKGPTPPQAAGNRMFPGEDYDDIEYQDQYFGYEDGEDPDEDPEEGDFYEGIQVRKTRSEGEAEEGTGEDEDNLKVEDDLELEVENDLQHEIEKFGHEDTTNMMGDEEWGDDPEGAGQDDNHLNRPLLRDQERMVLVSTIHSDEDLELIKSHEHI